MTIPELGDMALNAPREKWSWSGELPDVLQGCKKDTIMRQLGTVIKLPTMRSHGMEESSVGVLVLVPCNLGPLRPHRFFFYCISSSSTAILALITYSTCDRGLVSLIESRQWMLSSYWSLVFLIFPKQMRIKCFRLDLKHLNLYGSLVVGSGWFAE